MRRLLQRLDAYDKAHPVWMHDDIRAHSRGRKGVIVAALVCVLAMMAGCSGVTQALDTPADGFDRIVSANGNGYDGDDMNTADDSVGDVMVAPAVDVSNDDDVVVRSVVDDSSDERVAPQAESDGGTGENFGANEVYSSSNQTVYAQRGIGSSYKKWGTVDWMITDDGVLKIRPSAGNTGTTGPVNEDDGAPWYKQRLKIKKVESTGTIVLNKNSLYLFYDCSNLTDISGLTNWDVSNVTSMRNMFEGCSSLTDLTGLSGWNVSQVMYMNYMFKGCSSLTDLTGLASWKASKVTNMSYMFNGCSSLTALTGLAGWNVSKVTNMNMSYMFGGCSSLTDLTALSGWNVSNVKNMSYMFASCSGLTDLTPLEHWSVYSVTSMSYMFSGCSSLTALTGLASWKASKVTNMSYMFSGCSSLTDLTGLAGWTVSKGTNLNMSGMFGFCSSLTDLIALANWNVSNVRDMNGMFSGCSGLTALTGLERWNVSKVRDMDSMFWNCSSLTDLTALAGWTMSVVNDMSYMFGGCSSLTDLTALERWTMPYVTNMSNMFEGCSGLTDLTGLSSWNVSKVKDMSNMFSGCSNLQKVGIPSIDNGGQNLVSRASQSYLDSYLTTIITEDSTLGPYSWNQLKSEMQTNPDAFQEGTVWVKYTPSWFVFYDANGGLGSQDQMTMLVSQSSITLPQSSFVRFGYRFAGWTTQSEPVSDTNPLMQSGDMYAPPSIKEDDRFTLYAQWVPTGAIGDLPTSSQSGLLPGWVQIDQSNAHGVIPAMDTITASFTNKYDPNATSLELQFTKMMDGRIPDKSFDFELMDDAGKVLQTVKSVGSAVSFAPLSFNEVGEHIYYAHETNTTDSTIDYDTDLIQIKVSVTADPDDAAKLKATAQITGDTTFNNTSKPASLTISKKVEGTDDQSRSFTFDVMLTDRDNKPVNGSFVTDVSNGTQSSVTFVDGKAQVTIPANARLTIHGLDAYTSYQVSEPVDAMPGGYTLDAITGDTGVLAPAGSSTVTATNTYTAQPAYVTLSATKRLLNEAGDELIMDVGQFSFSLCRVESDDPASPCVGVSDASNDGAGNIAFEQLVFDAPGTYTYRIKEVNGGDAWTQYDKSIIEAVITVRDNAEGKLVADVAYRHADGTPMPDDATMPVFTNVALDCGGFAVTGSGPWMIAGIVAIMVMVLALAVTLIRRITTV